MKKPPVSKPAKPFLPGAPKRPGTKFPKPKPPKRKIPPVGGYPKKGGPIMNIRKPKVK